MLKTFMITTALSGLMIGGALAQTTPTNPQPAQPQATQPASPGDKPMDRAASSSPATGEVKFINAQGSDQWLSSNFIGVDVVGPQDEKIGDVSDILFDKEGNVVGYVVGVGGFLGIGAKNVALAPSSFQVMPAGSGSATTGAATSAASSDDIKLKLNMTKDQLKQAASFESKRDQDSKSRAASQPSPSGNMNRPAPK